MPGLERPPRWGTVALAVLAVVNVGMFGYLGLWPAAVETKSDRPWPPASASVESSPSTSGAAEVDQAETVPVLAVYGDGYSAGSNLGGTGLRGWPSLVAQRLSTDLRLHAVAKAGFEAVGTTGQDFAGIVTALPVPDAAVTVVFGSRNDVGHTPADVGAGAVKTLALIRLAAPATQLVVVGPAWSDADAPEELLVVRDAIRTATQQAGAAFVDPLADGWFEQPVGLIAEDGISPTDAGHEYLAGLIAPAVARALPTA